MEKGIRKVITRKGENGRYQHVRIVFGPHYFVELTDTENGLSFSVGATHHGITADASEIDGELEQIINELRNTHPENRID